MSYQQELYRVKLNQVIKDKDKYSFPEYLKIVRQTLGFTRDHVASFLDCSGHRVAYLEYGIYGNRGPDISFITDLANFYGQDPFEFLKKFYTYMDNPERPLTPLRRNNISHKSCCV